MQARLLAGLAFEQRMGIILARYVIMVIGKIAGGLKTWLERPLS